jgi:hypothetical protein
MTIANRFLILLGVLLALLSPAHAGSQDKMAQSCESEIESTERRITAARKKPEYKSEQGRQSLTKADRWLNQARRHAVKGESRNCVTAAKNGGAQLSAR